MVGKDISYEQKLSQQECLELFGEEFTPDELYSRVDVNQYAQKLSEKAFFLIVSDNQSVQGFTAYYLNTDDSFLFITRIAVSDHCRHQGIGRKMVNALSTYYQGTYAAIELEVEKTNETAMMFYQSIGFYTKEDRNHKLLMRKEL